MTSWFIVARVIWIVFLSSHHIYTFILRRSSFFMNAGAHCWRSGRGGCSLWRYTIRRRRVRVEISWPGMIVQQIRSNIRGNKNSSFAATVTIRIFHPVQVLSECLRIIGVPITVRTCTKDWKIPDTDIVVPKGMRVHIPIAGLHVRKTVSFGIRNIFLIPKLTIFYRSPKTFWKHWNLG